MWTGRLRMFSTLGRIPTTGGSGGGGLFKIIALVLSGGAGLYYYETEIKEKKPVEVSKLINKPVIDKTNVEQHKVIKEKPAEKKAEMIKKDSENQKKYKDMLNELDLLQKKEIVEKQSHTPIIPKIETISTEIQVSRTEFKPIEDTATSLIIESSTILDKKVPEDTSAASEEAKLIENQPPVSENIIPKNAPLTESSIPSEIKKIPNEDLSVIIENLKTEMKEEQKKRETELFEKLEGTFTSLLSEFSPKFSATKETPARVLANQIDFSKYTIEELQKKYEALIVAYEDRLENLGVRNYDSFIERLRVQKRKWKERIEQIQREHENHLQEKITERDTHWDNILRNEQEDSEKHYEKQAIIDGVFTAQQTELKVINEFEKEIKEITASLEKATENRLQQLEEITKKIKEMEEIQAEHYKIILKLKDIHSVHLSIENLQKTLTVDKGNLSKDLEAVMQQGKNDEVIKSALFKIDPLYNEIISEGIPQIKQIQNRFEISSQRARRAALVTSKSFFNVLSSMIVVKLIPRNIKTVDNANTFSILKSAEAKLDKGDLRGTIQELDKLQGYPKEEMVNVIKDISIRLAITELIEVLSGYTVSVVQKTLTSRVIS